MDKMTRGRGEPMYRLWIATYTDWRPTHWSQTPPRATAVEPVEDTLYSPDEAALFVEGFNTSVLGDDRRIWAVAVPVTVRYEGDAMAGMPIQGHAFPRESPKSDMDRQRQPTTAPTSGALPDEIEKT